METQETHVFQLASCARLSLLASINCLTNSAFSFAWRVIPFVKSNGILLAANRAVVGVGSGQPSRIDAVALACRKARERQQDAVLASRKRRASDWCVVKRRDVPRPHREDNRFASGKHFGHPVALLMLLTVEGSHSLRIAAGGKDPP